MSLVDSKPVAILLKLGEDRSVFRIDELIDAIDDAGCEHYMAVVLEQLGDIIGLDVGENLNREGVERLTRRIYEQRDDVRPQLSRAELWLNMNCTLFRQPSNKEMTTVFAIDHLMNFMKKLTRPDGEEPKFIHLRKDRHQ